MPPIISENFRLLPRFPKFSAIPAILKGNNPNLIGASGKAMKVLSAHPNITSLEQLSSLGLKQVSLKMGKREVVIIALEKENDIRTVYLNGKTYSTAILLSSQTVTVAISPPPQVTATFDPRLFDNDYFPQEEREKLLALYEKLPTEVQAKYLKKINATLNQPNEVMRVTQIRGHVFEMARILTILEQGLEAIDLTRSYSPEVAFVGYPEKTTDFSGPSTKDLQSAIEIDVPLVRNGQTHVYETKSYPRMAYGSTAAHHNQALRLQAAIEQGVIEGATIELRGRIDRTFLTWAAGTGPANPGHIPDVEIVYSFNLPSGAEYRFVLKRARNNHGLKFHNPEWTYTAKDQEVIKGIKAAIAENDENKTIFDIITSTKVNEPSEELSRALATSAGPMSISNLSLFQEYEAKRMQSIWAELSTKTSPINVDNKNSVMSLYAKHGSAAAVRQAVFEAVKNYLLFLEHNEATARRKGLAVIKEPEKINALVEEIMSRIELLREYELTRSLDAAETARVALRAQKGYAGRPEGVALDLTFIIVDSMRYLALKERGSKKLGYVYTYPADRFKELAAALVDLAKVDRAYREVTLQEPYGYVEKEDFAKFEGKKQRQIFETLKKAGYLGVKGEVKPLLPVDLATFTQAVATAKIPLETADLPYIFVVLQKARAEQTTVILGNLSEAQVKEIVDSLPWENISRAEALIPALQARLAQLQEQAEKTPEEIKEAKALQIRLGNYNNNLKPLWDKIRALEGKIKETEKERSEVVQKASKEKKRETAAIYEEKIAALKSEIDAVKKALIAEQERYVEIIGGPKEWQNIARRKVGEKNQNLLKLVYAVTAEGKIMIDEEGIRGLVSSRATHSELGLGRNVYGAGELVFQKNEQGQWVLLEINNGSGHYCPGQWTLPYVKTLIEEAGISTSAATLEDTIMHGTPIVEP